MAYYKKGILGLVLLLLSLLCACTQQETPEALGSEVWETMPQLTYGVMDYEKLQILPWNSGRCEATSFNRVAETKDGYYTFFDEPVLCYADKTDLSLWVAVCARPDCKHSDALCNARIYSDSFVIHDDRIYFTQMATSAPELYSGGAVFFLASVAEDGTDKRFEFAFDEYVPSTTVLANSLLTSYGWHYNVVEMNADGTQTAHSYHVTSDGQDAPITVENWEGRSAVSRSTWFQISLWGDPMFTNRIVSDSDRIFFRSRDGALETVDTTQLPVKHAYISGDILRFFRINDGYYDMNIKTGEEVKLADAQLENSFASIVLPNCILESTLMTYLMEGNNKHLPEGTIHAMRLFDGETWREVVLPDELVNANGMTFVLVQCVTSDSIILYSRDLSTYRTEPITNYYIIDLTTEDLAMELFLSHSASHG